MKKITLAVLLAVVAAPALAECWPLEQVAQTLHDKFGEQPIGMGKSEESPGVVITVWTNPGTGTWTVTTTNPTGDTCMRASGTDWKTFEVTPLPVEPPGVPG